MSSRYLPRLSPKATAEDITDEINFVQILIDTCDSTSETYHDDMEHYGGVMTDLVDRLGAAQTSSNIPQTWQDGRWNSQYTGTHMQGEFVDDGLNLNSPSASTNPSIHINRTGTPGSYVNDAASSSTFSSPLGTACGSRKRGRTLSTNHAGFDHSDRKRVSVNPSPSVTSPGTPSSLDSLDAFEEQDVNLFRPRGSDHAGQRALNTQRSGMIPMQEQTSRHGQASQPAVQQTQDTWSKQPTQIQLPTRPHLPPPSNAFATSHHGYAPANAFSGNFSQPSGLYETNRPNYSLWEPAVMNSPCPNVQSGSFAPSRYQSSSNNDFGAIGHQRSLQERNMAASGFNAVGFGQDNYIDLTSDSPDPPLCQSSSQDLTRYQQIHNKNPSPGSDVMPGSFSIDPFEDLEQAYTGHQSNAGPTQGQYVPITGFDTTVGPQLTGSAHAGNRYQPDFTTQLNPSTFSTDFMSDEDFDAFLMTSFIRPPVAESTLESSHSLPPFNYPESNLASSAGLYVDKVQALPNLAPKTEAPEVLQKLLENIRPDEDIPPEQREETPKAMSTALMEHQKLGLAWLKKMEEGFNQGGILADDMGLGKTVQALALILSRPSEDALIKTTLIVAPVALMRQWENEIENKVRARFSLKVHIYHGSGKKHDFSRLQKYDVVLTTFGTLGSELKKKREWGLAKRNNPNWVPGNKKDKLSLVGDECKWYRVIIDEAQCIKNKNTLNAQAACELQATYRFCMTGTPMMNSIDELYSLINFLRIKPYNDQQQFNYNFSRPIKSQSRHHNEAAMRKLQVLLKAILLRRTKSSLIDGAPIITIPPKHIKKQHVVFSDDEESLYRALETKSQITFNRYLKANTVGRNYGNVLVLLLRLRQACCHPHLIKDLSVDSVIQDIPEDALMTMASQIDERAVARLKEQEGFECPICYDGVENPTIFIPCGHNTCAECFEKIVDPARGIRDGNEQSKAACPECRNEVNPKKVTDYKHFVKYHMPEKIPEDEREELEDVSDDESDSDDYDSEEEDEDTTLGGFIVQDEDPTESDTVEQTLRPSKKNVTKSKPIGKGKGKAPAKPKKTLAQLKKESLRNQAAKRHYLRRLRRNYESSAKIEKTMQLLSEIEQNDSTEKTIIFSQFTSLLDLLEVPLNDQNYKYQRYDGSMRANDRADAVNNFMEAADCKVMLISLKAGNAGLNLNKASQVIILDPFWNPFIEDQAIDRAHRMMQQRDVHVHRILVENTVEDRIIALQEKKRELITTALDENVGKSIARLGVRELAYLFGARNDI